MNLIEWAETAASLMEAVGIAVMLLGAAGGMAAFAYGSIRGPSLQVRYDALRVVLGRAIILGLEFLVAADIIRTVAIEPTLGRVGSLALIVLVRTFLSFSLDIELEGRLPWRRGAGATDRTV